MSARRRRCWSLDNLEGLIDLVQAGVVEIHPWGSTVARSGAAGPADLRSRSRRGRAVERGDRGGARRARPARGTRPARASSRPQAARACTSCCRSSRCRLGRGQEIHPVDRRSDGQGAARALRRHHEQERAARAHLHRLSPQRPRCDRGRRLLDARAADAHRSRRRSPGTSSPKRSAPIISTIDNLRQRLDVLKDEPWPEFFTLKQRLP